MPPLAWTAVSSIAVLSSIMRVGYCGVPDGAMQEVLGPPNVIARDAVAQ
ncbi:MAG: hypothetical protein ACE5FS_07930 [Paracoccaceae bacterium]